LKTLIAKTKESLEALKSNPCRATWHLLRICTAQEVATRNN